MQLITVNPTEFGLTDETAQNIKDQFLPMLNKMVELETEYNNVVQMPVESPETAEQAKKLRFKYRDVRKATEEIHKKQKAFYLNGGRYVDGWKNAQLFASQGKEDALKKIEDYTENMKKQKISELHESRLSIIEKYLTENVPNLGEMDEDVWQYYLQAKKKSYEDRMEAERIETEKIEKEKAINQLHQKRKLEMAEYWHLLDESIKSMNFGLMTDKYYNGLYNSMKKRRQDELAEQKRLREENEAMKKAQAEAEAERQRLTAELQQKEKEVREAIRLKQLEEEKAIKEAKKLAKAPIKKQLMVWVNGFDIADRPCEDKIAIDIEAKFESFKKWALQQVENI